MLVLDHAVACLAVGLLRLVACICGSISQIGMTNSHELEVLPMSYRAACSCTAN